jgi:hypothetical protein
MEPSHPVAAVAGRDEGQDEQHQDGDEDRVPGLGTFPHPPEYTPVDAVMAEDRR